jgi:hypothetical protein
MKREWTCPEKIGANSPWCTEPFRWFSAPAFVRTKKLGFFNAQAPLRLKCIDDDFESFVCVDALVDFGSILGRKGIGGGSNS